MIKNESADPDVHSFLSNRDYAGSARMLLNSQKRKWPELSEAYDSLNYTKEKEFYFDNYKIKIQFNPGRIKSSSAKVDPDSVKERKCFLCVENLPEEQEGIVFNDEYFVLVNPFPIFPEHFTISRLKHLPQTIQENFLTMLQLAKDLSRYYTVFYNGPKCGASAPDHMHFQACTSYIMPLENELEQLKKIYGELLIMRDRIKVFSVDDGLRKFFILESADKFSLDRVFNFICKKLRDQLLIDEEPMMNLIVKYAENQWRVVIFFREKHRPTFFEKGILWSPAAVDLAGISIFPREKDFNMISKHDLTLGFTEIIIREEMFAYIKKELKQRFLLY